MQLAGDKFRRFAPKPIADARTADEVDRSKEKRR
jgi:hypothetical protein